MIAHRKIGAPDRALKQDIADHGNMRRRVVENDMAGGVARAMIDVEREIADGNLLAIGQPAVGLEYLAVDAVAAAIILEAADPETVGFMRPFDGHAEFLRQRSRFAAMVDMAVGDENLLDGDAVLCRRCFEFGQVAAGIDERAAHGLRAPEQRAILLERRHRNDRGAKGGGIGHRVASDFCVTRCPPKHRMPEPVEACPERLPQAASRRGLSFFSNTAKKGQPFDKLRDTEIFKVSLPSPSTAACPSLTPPLLPPRASRAGCCRLRVWRGLCRSSRA